MRAFTRRASGHVWVGLLLSGLSLLLSPGCGGGDDGSVTYYRDVAPVLEKQCVSCHRDGGIAPFALDSYASAREYVAAMRQSITNRSMPPQPLTNDGSCQSFTNARWMSDDEIRLIGNWMDQGTLEGNPDDFSGTPTPSPDFSSHALALTTPLYTPQPSGNGGANDDYRCFLIEPGLTKDQFVTRFGVEPGNEAIVHHTLVFTVDPTATGSTGDGKTNAQVIESLEAQSGGKPGWDCYGLSGEGIIPNGLAASWAPGEGVTRYPTGTGLRLRQGDWVVVQMHYNLDYATGDDSSTVRLELADSVLQEGVILLSDGFLDTLSSETPASLPAGKQSTLFTWEVTFEQIQAFAQQYYGYPDALPALAVYGIYPHMHSLGRQMQVTVLNDQGETCAANVSQWDFNWQQYYFYEEPVGIGPGTTIRITCVYDTRTRSEPTLPGLNTTDEMCMLGAFVSIDSGL